MTPARRKCHTLPVFRRRPVPRLRPVAAQATLDAAFLTKVLDIVDRFTEPAIKCSALMSLVSIAPSEARENLISRLRAGLVLVPEGPDLTRLLCELATSYGVDEGVAEEANRVLAERVDSGTISDVDLQLLIARGFPTGSMDPESISDSEVRFDWQLSNGHLQAARREISNLNDQEAAFERLIAKAERCFPNASLRADDLPLKFRAYFDAKMLLAQALMQHLPGDGEDVAAALALCAMVPDVPRRLEILENCLIYARGTTQTDLASATALSAIEDTLPAREMGGCLARWSWYVSNEYWQYLVELVQKLESDAGKAAALITMAHSARMRGEDRSFHELRKLAGKIRAPRWRARALLPFSRMSPRSIVTHWRLLSAAVVSDDKHESLKVLADRWPRLISPRLLLRGTKASDLDAVVTVLNRRRTKHVERYWPMVRQAATRSLGLSPSETVAALCSFSWLLGPRVDRHGIRLGILEFVEQIDREDSRAQAIQHLTGGMVLE